MNTHLTDFYAMPEIYDVLHQPGTAGEVRTLERICDDWCATRTSPPRRVWLEPACGSGRLLRAAASRGHRVIGFDLEPGMIAFARSEARRSGLRYHRVFVADMRDFVSELPPGSIDFAFNTINSIRHLSSDAAITEHLRGVRHTLRPGGIYAVGISLSAYGIEQDSEDIWRGRGRGMTVTQIVQYLPPAGDRGADRFEPVISHLVVRRGRQFRDIDSTYRLRTYNLEQWRSVIRKSGLEVTAVLDDSGRPTTPIEPGYAIWVLRPAMPRHAPPRGTQPGRIPR